MRERESGVAIVGSGRMGELRAHISAHHPGVRFLACADSDPVRARNMAGNVGAQFHSGNNLDVIAHPDVNAVIVCTPNFAHLQPVLQAIEMGKVVLCEKPIGRAPDDANQIMDAFARQGAGGAGPPRQNRRRPRAPTACVRRRAANAVAKLSRRRW